MANVYVAKTEKGVREMPKKVQVELELPDEVFDKDFKAEDLKARVKEQLVLELLRERKISQGKATELLGISRWALMDLMSKQGLPVIDMPEEELQQELSQNLPKR